MTRPTKGSKEIRSSFVTELRADSQGDVMALVGRACSFNTLSQDLGGFREMISPGAFKRSLASGMDVKCLFNHDPNQILGRLKNKTLTVDEDDRGLKFRCQLNPASQSHRDIHAMISRGDISECSFAFMADPDDGDEWSQDVDENGQRFAKRTLRNVTLMDVSAVAYPAYNSDGATSVQARALPQYGAAEFLRYAQKRAKQLGILISMDRTTQQQYELIDALNRADAVRIGKEIESDLYAVQQVERQRAADKELERKMQIAAGRLRK